MSEPARSDAEQRWALVARTADRVGAITAITGVFSSRGVNFESIAGGTEAGDEGGAVALYRTTQRRSEQLVRTVGRLEPVLEVQARPADHPSVRAVGIMLLPDGVAPPVSDAATVTGTGLATSPLLVHGPLGAVERTADQVRRVAGSALVVLLAL